MFDCTQDLYDQAKIDLAGPVDFVHTYVDFGNLTVTVNRTKVHILYKVDLQKILIYIVLYICIPSSRCSLVCKMLMFYARKITQLLV